jgi:dolichol-phosphate mannosyltransferase
LIEAVEEGADFAIGSRYVPGGKIPEDWSFLRRMNSRWGNVFARYVAGMYQVRDCTAGFRAIRASIVKKIDLDALKVRGYAFQISLLYEAILNHAKVREIPVEFVDRKRGQTKLGLSDIVEFMLNAWWIRFERNKTFLRFSAVGTTGVVVNLASFTKLMNMGLSKFIASPLAIELSIITNFLLNNFWTFRNRENDDRIHIRGVKFNVVSVLSLGVSYATFVALSRRSARFLRSSGAGILPALRQCCLNSY